MAGQKKVIDASVLVKAFTREEGNEQAVELLKQHAEGDMEIVVPELIFLETINALRWNKNHAGRLQEIHEAIWGFQLSVQKIDRGLLQKAILMSLSHEFTIYDAVYAALSIFNSCPLITCDEALKKLPNAIGL